MKAYELLVQDRIDTTDWLLLRAEAFAYKCLHETSGQRLGFYWKYLLVLAVSSGVEPDRVVMRFVECHLVQVSLDVHELVHEMLVTANDSRITDSDLDHRIWAIELSLEDSNGVAG